MFTAPRKGESHHMKKMSVMLDTHWDDNGNRHVSNRLSDKAREILSTATEVRVTRKWDGVATMLDDNGDWWVRRCVKKGKKAPAVFLPVETDPNTGHTFGWEPYQQSSRTKLLAEAVENAAEAGIILTPGTYELVGPKINGNPDKVDGHQLKAHGEVPGVDADRFDVASVLDTDDPVGLLKPLFAQYRADGVEGVVLWVDGVPMLKLRAKDFFPEMDGRYRW